MAVLEKVVEVAVREFNVSSPVIVTLASSLHSACCAPRGHWQEWYRQTEQHQRGLSWRPEILNTQEAETKTTFSHCEKLSCTMCSEMWNSPSSNRCSLFCGYWVVGAVCLLILPIFDVSGRGWAVMWKMTSLFGREPKRQEAETQAGFSVFNMMLSVQPHYIP